MVVISPHFDVHAIATKPTQLAWADAPSLDDVKKTRQTISDQGFRSFLFLMKLGSVHKHDPHRCHAASPVGNSCFPRTYSTRSRIGFFLMRVNRASGWLRQIAISNSKTVIMPSRNGYWPASCTLFRSDHPIFMTCSLPSNEVTASTKAPMLRF